MSAIWFTSDTHLGHKNIIQYSNRPFTSVEQMDKTIIDNINKLVKPEDTLYHLGDWSWGRHEEYRRRISCRNIILIYGNHDKEIRRASHLQRLFRERHELLEVKVGDRPIVLCHYAMRVWNKSHHGSWHLYGHSHGILPDDPNSLSFDIGVDCWNYKPISLATIAEKMKEKHFVPIDHHGTAAYRL